MVYVIEPLDVDNFRRPPPLLTLPLPKKSTKSLQAPYLSNLPPFHEAVMRLGIAQFPFLQSLKRFPYQIRNDASYGRRPGALNIIIPPRRRTVEHECVGKPL